MNDGQIPSSPAAPVSEPFPRIPFMKMLAAGVMLMMSSVAVPVVVFMMCVQPTMVRVEALLAETVDTTKKQADAFERLQDEIQVPPTNDKLFSILAQGVGVTEDIYRTTNVGTTPDAAFATDLTSGQQSSAFTQDILVKNTHASQKLCVSPIAWATAGATCALKCAGATITCSGAATDGWSIDAGSTLSRRFDGTSCVCVVGSGASTTYQSERVLR